MGLILFFAGIKLLSSSMKDEYIKKFKGIIDKVIRNEFIGAALGIIASIVFQNSSLVAISAIILVNSELMSLRQAFSIILGVTIALQLNFNISPYLYTFILIILILFMIIKSKNKKSIVSIVLSYVILLIGLLLINFAMQEDLMSSLLMTIIGKSCFCNILIGLCMGTLYWSSSYSVGILIALSATGYIDIKTISQILIGFSVATSIPILLSNIVTSNLNKEAKKTTLLCLFFNTVIVLIQIPLIKATINYVNLISEDIVVQIVRLKSIFGSNIIIEILILISCLMVINWVINKVWKKRVHE
ncbi:Na/Pi symporter [Clostridium taeniosporum]|nr:Na/Pi symporter [Clostridium taeniosporum]